MCYQLIAEGKITQKILLYLPSQIFKRRSGRAVDCTGLENRQGVKAFGGSNPSSSAERKMPPYAAFFISNALLEFPFQIRHSFLILKFFDQYSVFPSPHQRHTSRPHNRFQIF